jgi:hypothetical protein
MRRSVLALVLPLLLLPLTWSVQARDDDKKGDIITPIPRDPITKQLPPINLPSLTNEPAAGLAAAKVSQDLKKGQVYIADWVAKILIDQFPLDNTGEITVTERKGPLTWPAEMAVNRKPDANDPEIVTIPGPYCYFIKGKTKGKVLLDICPTLNKTELDPAGKILRLIPFTREDVVRRTLNVFPDDPTPVVVTPPTTDPPVVKPTDPPVVKPTDPTVLKGPIPVAGNRVLIVYSTADLNANRYTPEQQGILTSKTIRDYLKKKCVAEEKPDTHGYRILPVTTAMDGEPKLWQDAMNRQRSSLPWILISTGSDGIEQILPSNTDETMKLLKKYFGD